MTMNYAQFSSVHLQFFAQSLNLSLFVPPAAVLQPNAAQVGSNHFHHGRTDGPGHAALR